MKKTITLLIFLLVINTLILGNLLIIKYNNDLNIVPISYAKTSIDNNDNYNLIVNILKDANKNNFIQYAEYIDINFVSNINNAPKNTVAFTLSLPQQVSFIAFYDQISDNNFKFSFIIDNLSEIDNFYFYKNFLVVEQNDNKTSTDYAKRNYIEIFYNINDKYQPVFSKNTYSSKFVKYDKSLDMENIQYIESSSIDFLEGDLDKILCVTTITINKEKASLMSNSKEYVELEKNTKKQIYQWNSKKSIFEINKFN